MSDFRNSRNKHKRVYGYERAPALPFSFTETDTGIQRTFDRNSIVVHRDYFLIRDSNGIYAPYEYEEYLINTTGSSGTVTFLRTGGFSGVPIVTLNVDSPADNVNLFLTDVTTTGFSFGISSNFSGSLNYKAINAPSYPVTVTRSPLYSTTAEIYAGQQTETAISSSTIAYSFASPSIPTSASLTTFDTDTSVLEYVDTYASGTLSTSGSNVDFSSVFSGILNYIVIK